MYFIFLQNEKKKHCTVPGVVDRIVDTSTVPNFPSSSTNNSFKKMYERDSITMLKGSLWLLTFGPVCFTYLSKYKIAKNITLNF
jgi:hypothetical protein